MSRVLPTRLAVITGAAAVLLAACSSDGVVSPVTSPPSLPSKDIGIAEDGITQVCIDPSSPQALYTFALSSPLNFLQGDVFEGAVVSINTAEAEPICRTVLRKFNLFDDLTIASILIEVSIFPNIPGTWSFTCVADAGDGSFCPVSGTTNILRAGASGPHGSTITFKFTPLVLGPLFVIGDEQIHTVGSTVNFWGAHWFANNPMSGLVSNGASSFKGFSGSSEGVCGGTWTSNPGNSSPPPATIPTQIAVIVTSTLNKSGSNISGNIQQILLVNQDGGYNNNPGSAGNGVVTAIACQQP